MFAGVEKRWTLAAVATLVATGFWQPGGILLLTVLISVIGVYRSGSIPQRDLQVIGVAVVGIPLVVVLPLLYEGAIARLVIQTLVTPLSTGGNGPSLDYLVALMPLGIIVIGAFGAAATTLRTNASMVRYWPAVLLLLFLSLATHGDQHSTLDLIPLALLLAVGVCLAIGIAHLGVTDKWLPTLGCGYYWSSYRRFITIRRSGVAGAGWERSVNCSSTKPWRNEAIQAQREGADHGRYRWCEA